MNYIVKVNRPDDTFAVGRNGIWKVRGVEIMHGIRDTIVLTPIGKGGVVRAGFSIPIETMDEICDKWIKNRDPKALRKSLKNAKNSLTF